MDLEGAEGAVGGAVDGEAVDDGMEDGAKGGIVCAVEAGDEASGEECDFFGGEGAWGVGASTALRSAQRG